MPRVRKAGSAAGADKAKTQQQQEIVKLVKRGKKTAADAARLFGVHRQRCRGCSSGPKIEPLSIAFLPKPHPQVLTVLFWEDSAMTPLRDQNGKASRQLRAHSRPSMSDSVSRPTKTNCSGIPSNAVPNSAFTANLPESGNCAISRECSVLTAR